MYINDNPVFASGTLVIMAGESGSIDMPDQSARVLFQSDGGAPGISLDKASATLTFTNFDSPTGFSGSVNFSGGAGSSSAGKTVYLAFAVYTMGTGPVANRVLHFTVVVR